MNKRKIHVLTLLVAFSLVASVLAVPAQAYDIEPFEWPNWDEAAAYPDTVGDVIIDAEDMTVCYVTHDEEVLYFRVEFVGLSVENAGTEKQDVFIFLDIDRDRGTGSTYIGETGADYFLVTSRIFTPVSIEVTPIEIYEWKIGGWDKIAESYDCMMGDVFINLAVALCSLDYPEFPIDILFQLGLDTDYNPNIGYHTYPPQPSPAVGGEIAPLSLIALIPWIALIGAGIAVGYTLTRKKPILC